MRHYGTTDKEGKVSWENYEMIVDDIRKRKNRMIYLEVFSDYNKRTTSQNRYYWGVVIELIFADMVEKGNELPDDSAGREIVHEFLKKRFLEYQFEFVDKWGVVTTKTITKSTSRLSTVEFNEYIDKCVLFATEFLDLIIPSPERVEA